VTRGSCNQLFKKWEPEPRQWQQKWTKKGLVKIFKKYNPKFLMLKGYEG